MRQAKRRRNLVTVMCDHTPALVELNVIWHRTRHLIPKVRLIVDELLKKPVRDILVP